MEGAEPSALTGRDEKEVRKRDGVREAPKARVRCSGKTFLIKTIARVHKQAAVNFADSDSSSLLPRRSSSHYESVQLLAKNKKEKEKKKEKQQQPPSSLAAHVFCLSHQLSTASRLF